MKIAIASRGLIRSPHNKNIYNPDPGAVSWCDENLSILKDHFQGHELTTFLCSWDVPNSIDHSKSFDHSFLLSEPPKEFCYSELPIQPIWFRDPRHYCHQSDSLYKFFSQSKAIMEKISQSDTKFDYIVATRPDLRIRIADINEWMNGKYSVPGMSFVNFNDHINIAPADTMFKVWDYSIKELHDAVETSLDTEDVLKKIVKDSDVEYEQKLNITEYMVRDFNVVHFYNSGGYENMKRQLLGAS